MLYDFFFVLFFDIGSDHGYFIFIIAVSTESAGFKSFGEMGQFTNNVPLTISANIFASLQNAFKDLSFLLLF